MENAQIRRDLEVQRRDLQISVTQQQQRLGHQKLLARLISKQTLGSLKQSALAELEDTGTP